VHRPEEQENFVFGDVIQKRSALVSLSENKAGISFNQKSEYKNIGVTQKSTIAFYYGNKQEIEVKSTIKIAVPGIPSTHVYLGISNNLDGSSIVFGLKISSFKIMHPILIVSQIG
jgi:hypothetical protein